LQLRWTEWAFSGWNKGFFPWGLKWCANSLRLAWHLPTSRSRTREQQNSCVDGLRSNLKWFQHLKICFYIFFLFVSFILSNKQYLMSVFHLPLLLFAHFLFFKNLFIFLVPLSASDARYFILKCTFFHLRQPPWR
jgi:hypothetical protein